MLKSTLILVLFATSYMLSAQTVENIRVEQEGENLLIHYRIGGSTTEQLYDVKLTCTIDDGPVFEPRSVIGDVGKNIRGGKSFNTIVWDVFEDVEEVGSVEFFVEVVLVEDESQDRPLTPAQQQPTQASNQVKTINQVPVVNQEDRSRVTDDKGFMVSYLGSTSMPLGLMVGSLSKWGGYGCIRGGYYIDAFGYVVGLATISAGVTRKVSDGEMFDLYGHAGLGGFSDSEGIWTSYRVEGGLIGVVMNRVNINLGLSYMGYFTGVEGLFGVGIVF